jgi:amino acid transporter
MVYIRKILIVILVLMGATMLLPEGVLAQGMGFREGFDAVDAFRDRAQVRNIEDLPTFIRGILAMFLALVSIIAVAVLVYGGFLFITAAGNEETARRAKTLVLYAIIGLLLIGASAIIVNVIINAVISR